MLAEPMLAFVPPTSARFQTNPADNQELASTQPSEPVQQLAFNMPESQNLPEQRSEADQASITIPQTSESETDISTAEVSKAETSSNPKDTSQAYRHPEVANIPG